MPDDCSVKLSSGLLSCIGAFSPLTERTQRNNSVNDSVKNPVKVGENHGKNHGPGQKPYGLGLSGTPESKNGAGLAAVLLFPSVNDPTVPVTYRTATDWLRAAEKLAGLDPLPHGAWHPFRRCWA
jgi:hypothetical protein